MKTIIKLKTGEQVILVSKTEHEKVVIESLKNKIKEINCKQ